MSQNTKKIFRLFILFLILIIDIDSVSSSLAQNQPSSSKSILSGKEIIKNSIAIYSWIQDQTSKVTLTLIEGEGTQRKIVVQLYWKDYNDHPKFDSKMLILTEFPSDLKGTVFLIWDYSVKGSPGDIWFYDPSNRGSPHRPRTRRRQAAMASDLSFLMARKRRVDEDTHTRIGEEVFRGILCFVVESVPNEKGSEYGKRVSWISKENYTVQKIDYYDLDNELFEQQIINWQAFQREGFVWKKAEITNTQTGHKTTVEVDEMTLNTGLCDSNFTERWIRTGRIRSKDCRP